MVMIELDVDKFVARKTPQFLATFSACIGGLILGTTVVWTAPCLVDIDRSGEFGELTIDQKSWIASLVTLGGMVSGPFAGIAMGRFGRRGCLLGLSLPSLIGWLFIAFATGVPSLYFGRFVLGFCVGCFTIIVNVYIAELADEKNRGTLGFMFPIAISAGVLYTYVMGALVSWKTLTYVNMVFPVALLFSMYYSPESPVHLLEKGKKKEAGKCLMWFRGAVSFDQIENELQKMQHYVEESAGKKSRFLDHFTPQVMKPTLVALGLMVFQQLSGVNVILFYTVEIFRTTGSNLDSHTSSIIVGIVVLASCCVSTPFIDRAGRRILLLLSAAGMSIALAVMGIFFYLKAQNDGVTPESLNWLPLASLLSFIIALNTGYGPIPWLMLGELIPSHVKGTCSALVTTVNWFLGFLMIKTFEDMANQLGMYGVYWFFASWCFIGIFFSLFLVPETRGKSLEDIQKLFSPSVAVSLKSQNPIDPEEELNKS